MSQSEKSEDSPVMFSIAMANYVAPKIEESKGEDKYVTYGEGNQFFTYINECYNGSPTNRAAINSIAQAIYGKGLAAEDVDEDSKTWEEITDLLKPRDLKLLAMDLKQYGQCALQLGYDSDHTKILKAQHQPISTLAIGKKDKFGNVNKYWYSADFTDPRKYKPVAIPAFGTSKKQVEIIYIQNYIFSSGMMYYTNVDYQSGLQYAKVEEEISNFHLNNIMNGFTPSMMLNFNNGKPSEPEQLKIENKVKQRWGGTSNAGKVMISFNNGPEEAPTMEAVTTSDSHLQYQTVSEEATDKILISHRIVSPALLGIRDKSGFSSVSDEIKTSFQLYSTTVVAPFQDVLVDGLQEVLAFNNLKADIYFKTSQPIEFTDGGLDATLDADAVVKETGVQVEEGNVTVEKTLKKA